MTFNQKDAINIGKLMRAGKTEEVRKILGWEKKEVKHGKGSELPSGFAQRQDN